MQNSFKFFFISNYRFLQLPPLFPTALKNQQFQCCLNNQKSWLHTLIISVAFIQSRTVMVVANLINMTWYHNVNMSVKTASESNWISLVFGTNRSIASFDVFYPGVDVVVAIGLDIEGVIVEYCSYLEWTYTNYLRITVKGIIKC